MDRVSSSLIMVACVWMSMFGHSTEMKLPLHRVVVCWLVKQSKLKLLRASLNFLLVFLLIKVFDKEKFVLLDNNLIIVYSIPQQLLSVVNFLSNG